jgi:hypothetical protein
MRQPGRHLSYANVMVTVAVFLALGGGAYAFDATGGEGPAARTVTVSKSALKRMVRHEAAADVSAAAKKKKARRGPQGPPGASGPQGPNGVPGSPGVSGLQQVFKSSAVDTSTSKLATATCPPGKRAIGGGATHSNASPNLIVIDQIQPSDENTVPGTVTVSAYETGSATPSWSVTAFAVCANVS